MIKRYILWLLLASVLLTGCIREEAPMGLYEPNSALEQQTGGAVKVFRLPEGCTGLAPMGEDLVLLCGQTLAVYTGETLKPVREVTVVGLPKELGSTLRVGAAGIAYWKEDENAVVFLGTDLRQRNKVLLPEDRVGDVCISQNQEEIYYCTNLEVRVLDVRTGRSRLIRQEEDLAGIIGSALGDRVVICTTEQGERLPFYTKNGEVPNNAQSFCETVTGENWFYRQEKGAWFFGNEKKLFSFQSSEGQYVPVPEMHAMVGLEGTDLCLYDLESGKQTARVELDLDRLPHITADGDGLWLRDRDRLLYWTPEKSAVQEDEVYTAPCYTQEFPDLEGLYSCRSWAKRMGEQYGVKILVGHPAVQTSPDGYAFQLEYRVDVVRQALTQLEEALAKFPEGFLEKLGRPDTGDPLTIRLLAGIRSVYAGHGGEDGLYYWEDGKPAIALVIREEMIGDLYHQIGHAVDNRVLSRSQAYEQWNKLNPEGFTYDNSYIANENRQDDQYLGENRFFVSTFAMSFGVEDRASIFQYAMEEGKDAYFASSPLHRKLHLMCLGIRQAFALEEDAVLPWEQYLRA